MALLLREGSPRVVPATCSPRPRFAAGDVARDAVSRGRPGITGTRRPFTSAHRTAARVHRWSPTPRRRTRRWRAIRSTQRHRRSSPSGALIAAHRVRGSRRWSRAAPRRAARRARGRRRSLAGGRIRPPATAARGRRRVAIGRQSASYGRRRRRGAIMPPGARLRRPAARGGDLVPSTSGRATRDDQLDGAAVLVDTGPPDGPTPHAPARGSRQAVDALILTHAQEDHEGCGSAVIRELRTPRPDDRRRGAGGLAIAGADGDGRERHAQFSSCRGRPDPGTLGA